MMAPCIERKLAGMNMVGDAATALLRQRLGEAAAGAGKAKAVLAAALPLMQGDISEVVAEHVLVALGWLNAQALQLLTCGCDRAGERPQALAVHRTPRVPAAVATAAQYCWGRIVEVQVGYRGYRAVAPAGAPRGTGALRASKKAIRSSNPSSARARECTCFHHTASTH
jgi:hypothetical protein